MTVAKHRPIFAAGHANQADHPRAARHDVDRLHFCRLIVRRHPEAQGVRHRSRREEQQAEHREHMRGLAVRRAAEADREQTDGHQIRHQAHVGVSRAEDDPRQDREADGEHDRRESEVARQRQLAADQRKEEHQSGGDQRPEIEQFPPIAQRRINPAPLHLPVKPIDCLPAVGLAAPQRMAEENDQRDRREQPAPYARPFEPAEPQPQPKGKECQRDRQREIDEPEQEREAVDEWQREKDRRRNPTVDFARNPQETGGGQRRDGENDQFYCSLKAE